MHWDCPRKLNKYECKTENLLVHWLWSVVWVQAPSLRKCTAKTKFLKIWHNTKATLVGKALCQRFKGVEASLVEYSSNNVSLLWTKSCFACTVVLWLASDEYSDSNLLFRKRLFLTMVPKTWAQLQLQSCNMSESWWTKEDQNQCSFIPHILLPAYSTQSHTAWTEMLLLL